MKSFKRIAIISSILLLAAYIGIGLSYRFYSPEKSENYMWCAYHVHSTFSDGLLPLGQIAEEARKSGVDLVILTDHGRPHPKATTLNETIDGVRFIGGSEAGIPEGHINFFGATYIPKFHLPPYPPEAYDDIREWGGFGVLTYPEDPRDQWQYWEPDLIPDGIEIINITSYFRRASPWRKLAAAVFLPFGHYHFLRDVTPPRVALSRWDELLKRGKVLGFYATNAHGGFPITPESKTTVPVPSYGTAFTLVSLGIEKSKQDSLETAIRDGDFFSVIRGAGEPSRFEFTARLDERTYPSGSMISGPPEILLSVEIEIFEPRLVLKRNGEVIEETAGTQLQRVADFPGVYRAEIYLDDHPFLGDDVPWILSNPIFVDATFEPAVTEVPECVEKVSLSLGDLEVEKDADSSAIYRATDEGFSFAYDLAKATPETIDRWVALSLRKKMDLTPYSGFYIEASSEETMRYQVEIRSGDKSFYGSFKLYSDRVSSVVVPFDRFYATFGGREPIPLADIDSFFITINTSSTQTGFSSKITIREAGFCLLNP
jgi:hypothetical protein